MMLTPQKRRQLERRANRLLDGLPGRVVSGPKDASPRSSILLLTEHTTPMVVRRATIPDALHAIGLHLEGLDDVLAEIERSPADDGQRYPAIILLDGWARIAFVESFVLSRGGVA